MQTVSQHETVLVVLFYVLVLKFTSDTPSWLGCSSTAALLLFIIIIIIITTTEREELKNA